MPHFTIEIDDSDEDGTAKDTARALADLIQLHPEVSRIKVYFQGDLVLERFSEDSDEAPALQIKAALFSYNQAEVASAASDHADARVLYAHCNKLARAACVALSTTHIGVADADALWTRAYTLVALTSPPGFGVGSDSDCTICATEGHLFARPHNHSDDQG